MNPPNWITRVTKKIFRLYIFYRISRCKYQETSWRIVFLYAGIEIAKYGKSWKFRHAHKLFCIHTYGLLDYEKLIVLLIKMGTKNVCFSPSFLFYVGCIVWSFFSLLTYIWNYLYMSFQSVLWMLRSSHGFESCNFRKFLNYLLWLHLKIRLPSPWC